MKTITKFLVIILLIVLFSCGNKEKIQETNIKTQHVKELYVIKTDVESKDFANPFLIYGSSFGNFFQMLYKQGKFDDMLDFTSSGSVSKYGRENIRKMYENMKFAYDMKLKSSSGKDTIILNYEAGIYATKHMVRLNVVIENDTTKIVLNDLSGF